MIGFRVRVLLCAMGAGAMLLVTLAGNAAASLPTTAPIVSAPTTAEQSPDTTVASQPPPSTRPAPSTVLSTAPAATPSSASDDSVLESVGLWLGIVVAVLTIAGSVAAVVRWVVPAWRRRREVQAKQRNEREVAQKATAAAAEHSRMWDEWGRSLIGRRVRYMRNVDLPPRYGRVVAVGPEGDARIGHTPRQSGKVTVAFDDEQQMPHRLTGDWNHYGRVWDWAERFEGYGFPIWELVPDDAATTDAVEAEHELLGWYVIADGRTGLITAVSPLGPDIVCVRWTDPGDPHVSHVAAGRIQPVSERTYAATGIYRTEHNPAWRQRRAELLSMPAS